MNELAAKLGLSPTLSFHDVYSFDDPDLLALVPRPAYALLVIIPLTNTWNQERKAEDDGKDTTAGYGHDGPVVWFEQTIGHACGSIGLLHCTMNGPAVKHILPGSDLEALRNEALLLGTADRSALLYNSSEFEAAHQSTANLGESTVPSLEAMDRLGQHFVAFVKGDDGHLWELEGSRKGPLDRGILDHDEDVLSPKALDRGIRRIINMEKEAGGTDLRFSCIALAPSSG